MATDVTTRPQYLNANNLIYNFWDLRRYMDGDPPGPGAADYESFRVLPRQAGANLSVDVGKTSPGLMQAWVRGSTRDGQGLYRVDNIDVTAPSANTYLAQLNVAVTSNVSGNPRLDQVVLVIGDAQHAGATNKAYIDVIAGTPTGGATLDNRTGAAALPASCILLADILLASGDGTVDAVDIRDRRQYPLPGTIVTPPLAAGGITVDGVTFQVPSNLAVGAQTVSQAAHDNMQTAVPMYLPRRIAGATRIRWASIQGATANANNVLFAICDASGKLIVATAATAMTGGANTRNGYATAITATTFEPGWYYVFFGTAAMTAGSTYGVNAVSVGMAAGTNVGSPGGAPVLRNAAGGTTFPAAGNILGMTNIDGLSAAVLSVHVPIPTLSIG